MDSKGTAGITSENRLGRILSCFFLTLYVRTVWRVGINNGAFILDPHLLKLL